VDCVRVENTGGLTVLSLVMIIAVDQVDILPAASVAVAVKVLAHSAKGTRIEKIEFDSPVAMTVVPL